MKPERWDGPALIGAYAGRPLAIVATGPSYETFPRAALDGIPVFALNAAITEFTEHADVTWICHDLHKIWQHNFRQRLRRYRRWRLVTRRVYVPGKFGAIAYRDVGGGRVPARFPYVIDAADLARVARLFWYAELPDQDGFLRAEETVLEIALRVARAWGFGPVVIVGADLAPVAGRAYAAPWAWKRCKIKPEKFRAMRGALARGRPEFPRDTFLLAGAWNGAPFPVLDAAGACATLGVGAPRAGAVAPLGASLGASGALPPGAAPLGAGGAP